MVDLGDADAMVTGVTRTFSETLENIKYVVDERPGEIIFGLTIAVTKKSSNASRVLVKWTGKN